MMISTISRVLNTISTTEEYLRNNGLELDEPIEWWAIEENNQLTKLLNSFDNYSKEDLFKIVRCNLGIDEKRRIQRYLELLEYEKRAFGFSSLHCRIGELQSIERKMTLTLFAKFTKWFKKNSDWCAP